VLGWPKRCKLAHTFLWEYSYKRLQSTQLLGQLGALLTLPFANWLVAMSSSTCPPARGIAMTTGLLPIVTSADPKRERC
jgi:hypothetical protein